MARSPAGRPELVGGFASTSQTRVPAFHGTTKVYPIDPRSNSRLCLHDLRGNGVMEEGEPGRPWELWHYSAAARPPHSAALRRVSLFPPTTSDSPSPLFINMSKALIQRPAPDFEVSLPSLPQNTRGWASLAPRGGRIAPA